ncbi:pentatricopeptide repeat-containing protein At3g61360-like [Hibiscus syriacus]|uniref:pentatricopeptide repeat-containing protein At3g61360-like n=1 Tax=Hibiscus syriacus TaxID=106335 RepID=UPI001920D248|nr:pentatricopeptide repeat-containing protein At3g61360-like [Hibiscus syriacus]
MTILLLGFKESGDVTAMEPFYHEMVRRGFKPNCMTYNIRIDAYYKKGCLGDGLRLLEEMERLHCLPTLETITTLIHGAGVQRYKFRNGIDGRDGAKADKVRWRYVSHDVLRNDEGEWHRGCLRAYDKMSKRNFVPKSRTVVMLMKFFCENQHLQQGLHLWDYLVQKGQCR